MARPELSLVIPVFNEELVLGELHNRLRQFLEAIGLSWQVVFVDDGSSDNSPRILEEICSLEPRFCLVSLSRNFGHQLAITAGMDYARGNAVVIMDADLQDPPSVVAEMYEKYQEGYDVVYGVRKRREGENFFKRWTAAAFYRVLKRLAGVPIPVDAGDFRLLSRRVVVAMRALRETNRFVRGMVAWVGFKQHAIYYDRAQRFAGKTHYPLGKMLRFAFDGIMSFSSAPLRTATWLGGMAGVMGIGVAIWAVFVKLYHQDAVPGWATIMIAVSLAASAQLLMTGVLGEYIGRIYEEVKNRPLYLVRNEVNVARDADDPENFE